MEICKLVFYSSLKGVSRVGECAGYGEGSARVSRWVWLNRGFPMSRAVRPWRPLGQPVVRRSVLVVGGRGGMGGSSRVVGVLWRMTRGATVTVVAVVSSTSVPVVVGTAVIPLTTWVITLSLESAPVALENLRGELKVGQYLKMIYTWGASTSVKGWGGFMLWMSDIQPLFQLTCLVGGGRLSLGALWVWVGGGVSSRLGLATEEDVELQRDRFE